MVEPLAPPTNELLIALHEKIGELIEKPDNADSLVEQALPLLIELYQGDKSKLLVSNLQKTIFIVEKFEPEQEPQNP